MNAVCSLYLAALAAVALGASAQTVDPRSRAPETTAEVIKVSSEIRQLERLSASSAPVDRWQLLWLHPGAPTSNWQ
jgi:hypothetical protein